ncbi:MAG: tRNA (adenosine(37)-N6)-dimethylallyltransferase MiaA [Candidatus Saccharimonas sp.]
MGEAPLVVIVGPTACGKTALAIRLAKQFGGEVISADSRAIYRGMNIGTAKPSVAEQDGVQHWGIDLVAPNERFTVVDFQRYALTKIKEIRARGQIPFLVGGSGLYIDSVIYEYDFPERAQDNLAMRNVFESWSLERLWEHCIKNNIELPENRHNKRYVVNNILRKGAKLKRNRSPVDNTIVVGITTEKEQLWKKIELRARMMLDDGLIDEARRIASEYGWQSEAMTGNTYRVAKQYVDGIVNEVGARTRLTELDRQLAKRQLTWFRRSEHIVWLSREDAYTYIAQLLAARLIS